MRVLMLLSKSFREDARVRKEAAALSDAGHEVVVIEWARHDPRAAKEERVHGVRVLRYRERGAGRLVPGTVFRNPLWWRGAARMASSLARGWPIDIVHAHDLDTLPAGVRIKRRTGARLVFDAHEIFAMMVRADRGAFISRAADRLEARLLPHVDHIVTVNEALAEHYAARATAPITVVMNAPEMVAEPPGWQPAPPFVVTYVGLLHPSRFFPEAVRVLGGMEGVRFVVAGKREGNWEEVQHVAAQYPNVEFLGAVPSDKVLQTLARGHAILCMLDPTDPQYQVATATKVLDAMALARPAITTSGTYTGKLVAASASGLVVAYDADAVREAVQRLANDPKEARRLGANGRRLAETHYHWAAQAQGLVELYAGLEG